MTTLLHPSDLEPGMVVMSSIDTTPVTVIANIKSRSSGFVSFSDGSGWYYAYAGSTNAYTWMLVATPEASNPPIYPAVQEVRQVAHIIRSIHEHLSGRLNAAADSLDSELAVLRADLAAKDTELQRLKQLLRDWGIENE